MTDRPPERVRVTGPSRRPTRRTAMTRGGQIDAETRLGEIYLRSLLREQLRLAVLSLLAVVAGLGVLPALFWLAPDIAEVRLLGMPLPWLLIGVAAYPYLALVAWWFVRSAERNEADFADLVETVDRP